MDSQRERRTVPGKPDDAQDGTWTFYDSWAAFPLNRTHEKDSNIVGEFIVSLDAAGGGTHGEFGIRFHQWRDDPRQHARLEAFGDSWEVLAASGLVEALAALDGQPQGMAEICGLLLSLGFEDRTDRLRVGPPLRCPECHGSGVLTQDRPYLTESGSSGGTS